MPATEKMGIGDNVIARLGRLTGKRTSRPVREKINFRSNVHAIQRGVDLSQRQGCALQQQMVPSLQLNLGIAYFGAKQFEGAVAPFRRTLELRPDLEVARLLLAQGLRLVEPDADPHRQVRRKAD